MTKQVRKVLLKPRHKWFSAPDRKSEAWFGPCNTIEAAIMECLDGAFEAEYPVFVTQGRKLTKQEREDLCVDYEWECEAENAIEVRLKLEVNPKPMLGA